MSTAGGIAPEDYDVVFRRGMGMRLAAQGVGVWKDTGSFASGDLAVVDGSLPASPENAVALMTYNVSDDPSLSDSVIGLQVTTRAGARNDPRPTSGITARVYDELHGMTNVLLPGGVYVVQCYRRSWTSTGQDEQNRWREVSNFYVTVHRPSKYRT